MGSQLAYSLNIKDKIMSLVDSLGLDNVSGNVNSVPDNTYDVIVVDVDYVHAESKNRLSHVITFQVEGGQFNGRRIQQWFTLGTDPTFDANGKPTGYKPTMSDGNKSWYKKGFMDLGVTEDQVTTVLRETDGKAVIGRKATVTVKTNAQDTRYQNVTAVKIRSTDAPVNMGSTEAAVNSTAPVSAPETAEPATLASQL